MQRFKNDNDNDQNTIDRDELQYDEYYGEAEQVSIYDHELDYNSGTFLTDNRFIFKIILMLMTVIETGSIK